MVISKKVLLLFFVCLAISCKKENLQSEISEVELYVESVKADEIRVKYQLSRLGYQETGVYYFQEANPNVIKKVKSIRYESSFQVALQDLVPNTKYIFQVYWIHNSVESKSGKNHKVNTLSPIAETYNLSLKDSIFIYNPKGNFKTYLIGNNLNNLNLAHFKVSVGFDELNFGVPELISGNKYQMEISGKINFFNRSIRVFYQTKEIFFKFFQVIYEKGINDFNLTYKFTTLRGERSPSVYKNNIYYFEKTNVVRWNDIEERLDVVGTSKTVGGFVIGANTLGFEFGNDIFFLPMQKAYFPPEYTPNTSSFPEAYSYSPENNTWDTYSFTENMNPSNSKFIKNGSYFTHNNELYLTYSLIDDGLSYLNKRIEVDNYLYKFNKNLRKFVPIKIPDYQISDFHFISVKNQIYLLGLAPVFDQGFQLSSTYCVYKVNDQNFGLEEIYRGGSISQPYTFYNKFIREFEGKILLGIDINDYLLFDVDKRDLLNVFVKNPINNQYLGGFFLYNSKLHLNADLGFYSCKIYEITITKD